MGKNDFYKKSTSSTSFYSGSTGASEPNMRQELINTFDGQFPEIAKAQTGLLRRMRRDADNNKLMCPCVDPVTKEPDKDRFCPICYGEAYYWDEEEIQLYRVLEGGDSTNTIRDNLTSPGLINIPLVVFYIRYDSNITRDDKIVELELELSGKVKIPKRRRFLYRVESAWDYRSDNGKLEYWKVFAHKEDVKHLNKPAYENI